MFFAEKQLPLSKQKSGNDSLAQNLTDQGIESDYSSQLDLTNNAADFSLPPVKRQSLISRKLSFNTRKKQSLELADTQQTSLGYSSLLSSPSSLRHSQNRTPKKRKLEENDENAFYNSYQFVSPLKIRKKDPSDINCAKLILKEKSSSENVIRSSTPIRNNKNKLWGKFRSLHPEKFEHGKSLEDVEQFEKAPILPKSTEASFDCTNSFDFTNSFNLTSNAEHHVSNIPPHLQQLVTGSMLDTIAKPPPAETVVSSQEKSQPILSASSYSSNFSSSSRKINYCGRLKLDILSKLHMRNDLALNKILSHLGDTDLLSLSHVSKEHRSMINSNKTAGVKLQKYLRARKQDENKFSVAVPTKSKPSKSHKKAFADSNENHQMQLRSKPPSSPVSPSRMRFNENQKVCRFLYECSSKT